MIWIIAGIAGFIMVVAISPVEKTLGTNARVVYIHGAFVWTALTMFMLAGISGISGMLWQKPNYHRWSRALGLAGLIFWFLYLPVSILAMQTNWNPEIF